MRLLFWTSLALIVGTYAGYPIALYFRANLWPKPIRKRTIFPHISIVIAVHNEEKTLSAKLHNLSALDYPAERLE